jgi:hypothetical protein
VERGGESDGEGAHGQRALTTCAYGWWTITGDRCTEPTSFASNRLASQSASMPLQTVSGLAQIELDAQLARQMQQEEAAAPEAIDLTEDNHRARRMAVAPPSARARPSKPRPGAALPPTYTRACPRPRGG